MAFHVFIREKVDATILEVGIGGTYDSTNIVPKPKVTGITTLGIDHIFVLGKTIEEIAQQKGGIFKEGVPALTVAVQPPAGLEVLRKRALELKASSFTVVEEKKQLSDIKLGERDFAFTFECGQWLIYYDIRSSWASSEGQCLACRCSGTNLPILL